MTKEEAVKYLQQLYPNGGHCWLDEQRMEAIGIAIKALQEEPINEDLDKAAKEWLIPQLDKSYANYGERKMMELTRFDGYAMLDAIEFGMKKMKEQMIKNAIEREVKLDSGGYPYVDCHIELYDYMDDKPLAKTGDKVKLIVIKED
jgi:hypothetical protein